MFPAQAQNGNALMEIIGTEMANVCADRRGMGLFPDEKNLHRLFEKLASLSIMGGAIKGHLKPLNLF